MKRNRLYDELADLWPVVSDPADYAREAVLWTRALRQRLGPGRHAILDLGTGGGHLLSHLTAEFDATAVDLSHAMLDISRRLNPTVDHRVGDMRSIRLSRTFAAVLIHDAADYLLDESDIARTFETAAAHTEPGGLLIVAPDRFTETFDPPEVSHDTGTASGVEVTWIAYAYDSDPEDTTIESIFTYYIREGGNLRIEQDRHTHGLFPLETWTARMRDAGFDVETEPYDVHDDRREARLIVGTRA